MYPLESLSAALANVIWTVDMHDADDSDSLREVVRLGTYLDGLREGYLDGWRDARRI